MPPAESSSARLPLRGGRRLARAPPLRGLPSNPNSGGVVKRTIRTLFTATFLIGFTLAAGAATAPVQAQGGPAVLDPNLGVRTVVSGLVTPSTMAFLGPNDFLVLEKNTGRVKRVVNGAVAGTVIDLSVNSASERGLLGNALHPRFPANPGVYLFWSCRSVAPLDGDPFTPEEQRCSNDPSAMFGA